MNESASANQMAQGPIENRSHGRAFRISMLVLSYLWLIAAFLSVYSVPWSLTGTFFALGIVFAFFAPRTKLPLRPVDWIVLLAGMAAIFLTLTLFGQERVRLWRPFPAFYIPVWVACVHGFRHIRHEVHRS